MRWRATLILSTMLEVGCAGTRPTEPEAPVVPPPRDVGRWNAETARMRLAPPPREPADLMPLPPAPPPVVPPLAPHADLAYLLKTPRWLDACGRADVDRQLAGYLAVWCGIARGRSPAAARDALVRLPAGESVELALAARADIVDLLARDGRGAVAAQGYLAAYRLDDEPTLDELIAAYIAAGRRAEALQVVAGLNLRTSPGADVRCQRLVSELGLVTGPRVDQIRAELASLRVTPGCERSFVRASCPVIAGGTVSPPAHRRNIVSTMDGVRRSCDWYLGEDPERRHRLFVAIAFAHWPHGMRDARAWAAYATYVAQPLGRGRTTELALAALENAVVVSDCAFDLRHIRAAALALSPAALGDPVLAERATEIARVSEDSCIAARQQALPSRR